jgi:hypothetical protein
MKNKSSSALRRRRKNLLKKLPPLDTILRGSLIERFRRCGKQNCHCHQEGHPGHGPKYYLSVSRTGQRPEMDYIPQDYQEQASEYLNNFQVIRKILKESCDINRELIRRSERL